MKMKLLALQLELEFFVFPLEVFFDASNPKAKIQGRGQNQISLLCSLFICPNKWETGYLAKIRRQVLSLVRAQCMNECTVIKNLC